MQQRLAEAKLPGLRQGDEPIPGYRLVRRRGRGGFGEVWEAEASGGFRVALKFVHFSPRAQAAELRALNCVRGIHHPNLLANFGSWQVAGTLVVGMELADGSLWDRYIEAANQGLGGIPRRELLGYMAEAAGGIDYLNEPRHTVDGRAGRRRSSTADIKPPNILLFGGGAKVADLGMARAMEGDQGAHTGIWTFAYAAPEFFRGRTTRRSDQYSLAVTYCQLRCGRLPFGGNAAAVTAGHLYGQPDLEGLPEPERPILERALAKEPVDRWPDCRALVEALRALEPDRAPEFLPRPDEPSEDISRMLRPSTGASGSWPASPGDLEDAPLPSWRPFDSSGSLEDLMETSDPEALSPVRSGPTALLADAGHGLTAPERTRPSRIGRQATATLVVGLAIVAVGLRPTTGHGPDPRTPPTPAPVHLTKGAEIPSPPDLVPERATRPDVPTPSPTSFLGVRELAPAFDSSFKLPDPLPPRPSPLTDVSVDRLPTKGTLVGEPPMPPRSPVDPAIQPASAPAEALAVATGSATPAPGLAEARARSEVSSHPVPVPARVPAGPGPVDAAALAAEARGRVHLAREAFEPAIAEFDEVIRLRPGLASAYFQRGLARHRASHYPEALADYGEAIRLRPADPFAFIARGQAHHDLGAYDRALADYGEAIRLRPTDSATLYRRGLAYYWSDDFAGALADFTETIRLDPKNKRALEFRDDALARLGGRAQAGHEPPSAPAASPSRPAPASPGPAGKERKEVMFMTFPSRPAPASPGPAGPAANPQAPPAKGTPKPRPGPLGIPSALIRVLRRNK